MQMRFGLTGVGSTSSIILRGLTIGLIFVLGGLVSDATLLAQAPLSQQSDSQLIDDLAAGRSGAPKEILNRGARIVPLLLKLKGDQRPYLGTDLGHRLSATAITLADVSSEPRPEQIVTIEVAALYLICAIYYDGLEFAQSPYLTDLRIPAAKRKAKNLPVLITRAWKSTTAWSQRLHNKTIDDLRLRKDHPLRGSGVAFW